MGNNLQALNAAKSLTKQLVASKAHLAKTNERQQDVNPPRNKPNTDSTRSDYGVYTHRQTVSSTNKSGYLKEASDGLAVMGVSSKHPKSSGVLNDNCKESNTNSFVYYSPPKLMEREILPSEDTGTKHQFSSVRKGSSDQNQNNNSNVTNKKNPIFVDLTIDDSDDDDGETKTQESSTNTLPKILAAYSLNSKHSSFPATELCNLLSERAKENLAKQIGIGVNSPKPQNTDILHVTEPSMKNGLVNEPKNDINYVNDVMNDVTNLQNGDLSNTKKMEYKPTVFSSWTTKHEGNVDSCRQQVEATLPTDSGDQVIITKVVKSTDKIHGRKNHPRKATIEVRKLFLDDTSNEKERSTNIEQDVNKKSRNQSEKEMERNSEECSLVEVEDSFTGNTHGTPWSFTLSPVDKSLVHRGGNNYRENKIRNLKDRLAKQQEAVEKLRVKEKRVSSSRVNGIDRVLVVQIPDLKSKLQIQSKKQSFRVFDQSESVKTKNDSLLNKRKRKALPRKVNRESCYRYESDDITNVSYVPSKRTRRIEKETTAKQRLPRRPRGRNSPVTGKLNSIPVVEKDLWHREMERVEALLAVSNQPIDQTSFMLFLGLRKVESS